jgi:hypothetical protein
MAQIDLIAKIMPKNAGFTGMVDADQVIAGTAPITGTGVLGAGSIASGFGTIDNGSSAITTTGTITGGNFTSDDGAMAAEGFAVAMAIALG